MGVIMKDGIAYGDKKIITYDKIPTKGSANPVESNGVFAAITNSIDSLIPSVLNAKNYSSAMKLWFNQNGSDELTDFTSLCDQWYTITRTGWTGGTRFYRAVVTMASDGEKVGDNVGMVAEPSTNTVAGRDDYQDIPLFHCIDCNWFLDENGKPHITAIDGVCGEFERYNPSKLVGVLQMTGWIKYINNASNHTYTYMYTDEIEADGYYPLPEAVNLDGTVRTWVVHAKYASGEDYGSYSGVAPWTYTASHNSAITAFHTKWGNQYGGKTSADDAFLKLMFYLKYANLSADGILQGCTSYNYQYSVEVEETNVERVILSSAAASNIKVGSTVMVGNPTSFSSEGVLNIDRIQNGMKSKVDRKKVTHKEVLSNSNVAIYIDNGGVTFNTTSNTIATTGDSPTYISSSPWYTGTCDNIKGVDGSPTSFTNGTEPVKLQGIEYALGSYEVICDSILKYYQDSTNKYHLTVYICRDSSKYSTEITSDYESVNYEIDCPNADTWQYIEEIGYDINAPEVWFPSLIGCTSSQRTKDAIYILSDSTDAFEWLSIGTMSTGNNFSGLSVVRANYTKSQTGWHLLARLSSTGNRGTWSGGGN